MTAYLSARRPRARFPNCVWVRWSSPILAWFFRNTPYFEDRNPYPLLRQRMWDYLWICGTANVPGLFDSLRLGRLCDRRVEHA